MFQLRGHGLGEMDCAANPNDPVCIAYYGTSPSAPLTSSNKILAALSRNAPLQYSAVQNNAQGAANAGANVVLQSSGASPIATSAGGLFDLLAAIPWWIKLGAVAGGGYLAYTKWFKKAA